MIVPRAPRRVFGKFDFLKKLLKFYFLSMAVTVLQTENQIMDSRCAREKLVTIIDCSR